MGLGNCRFGSVVRGLLLTSIITGISLSSPASSGTNEDGSASLSWHPTSIQADISPTSGTTFPIYLQLHGVHDIRELAVDLVWSPADSAGAGYEFLSSSPDAECAWTERAGFSSSFNGDSTYSWSILADTPTILCVAYTVAAPTIVVELAIFRLNSVFVRDSAGAIDTLGIGSATATILGNLTVNNVHPTVVPPRPEVVLSVHGSGLVSTSRAFLVTDDVSIPMNEALESSDSVLVASFNVTSSNAQVFDLTIETQDGHSTTYAAAVVVAGPLPPAYPLPVLVDAPAPLPASAIALTRGGLLVSYSDQTGFVYVRTLDDELITLWPVAGLQYVDNLAIDDADRVFVFGGDAPELTIVRVFTLSGGSLASWTAPSGPTAIDYSGNVYIAFGSILRRYSTYLFPGKMHLHGVDRVGVIFACSGGNPAIPRLRWYKAPPKLPFRGS